MSQGRSLFPDLLRFLCSGWGLASPLLLQSSPPHLHPNSLPAGMGASPLRRHRGAFGTRALDLALLRVPSARLWVHVLPSTPARPFQTRLFPWRCLWQPAWAARKARSNRRGDRQAHPACQRQLPAHFPTVLWCPHGAFGVPPHLG